MPARLWIFLPRELLLSFSLRLEAADDNLCESDDDVDGGIFEGDGLGLAEVLRTAAPLGFSSCCTLSVNLSAASGTGNLDLLLPPLPARAGPSPSRARPWLPVLFDLDRLFGSPFNILRSQEDPAASSILSTSIVPGITPPCAATTAAADCAAVFALSLMV